MNRPLPLVVVCLSLGFAVGWLSRPLLSDNPAGRPAAGGATPARSVAAAADGGDRDPPTKGPGRSGKGREAGEQPVMVIDGKAVDQERMEETQAQVEREMKRRLVDTRRKRLEDRLAKLVKELALTPEQLAALQADIERRIGVLDQADGLSEIGDVERLKELAQLLKPDALDETLAPMLAADQTTRHSDLRQKEKQARVEARALKDLSGLTTLIDLTAGQRDAVYQVFAEQASRREEQAQIPRFMEVFSVGSGIEIHDELGVGDLVDQQMASIHAGGDAGADDGETRFREAVDQRVNARIEAVRPHLSPEQLARYRSHLEEQAATLTRGIVFQP